MNRWIVRLKCESGLAPLESVLVVATGAVITLAFLGVWSAAIRPALHDAIAAHLEPVEAGATSPPGTGPATPPPAERDEPEPVPLDAAELARQERKFVRAPQ